jgi:hypothetical protein
MQATNPGVAYDAGIAIGHDAVNNRDDIVLVGNDSITV